ncbi:uncharacterized protein LOC123877616, partial [Maniola jurtina]|uniref:uncharacterized protein LOC123877616 n=1 Tax=Maniola jurtina TaxID=191418 RepID=UPI001E68A545
MPPASTCVALHAALLRRAGYMRARTASRAHAAYRALVLALTATYLLQECAHAARALRDMRALARVMFLLLCHVTAIAKQLVFLADADRIDAMVHSFDGAARAGRAAALERGVARGARRLLVVYAGTAVLTCTLWLLFPVLRRARGLPDDFPFWTGVGTEPLPAFAAVLLYSFGATTLVAIANTTMDAFLATVLAQCKAQLTILRMDLQSLPERAASLRAASLRAAPGASTEAVLMRLFVECYHQYRKVTETVALLQDVFGTALLMQFGIGGWILCMAAYQLVSLAVLSIEFASMLLFIVCILTELFLYCYYGNDLTAESDRIVFAVYAMSWERTPLRFRRCLLLLMERARRPLRPVAGRVVPLSLDTFVKVRRAAPRRTAQSDRIVFAVYAMSWERTPLRFRRCLAAADGTRAPPLRPVAGRVVPLSLDTFVKVRRAAPRRTAQSDRIVFAVYAMSWERTPLRFRRCLLLLMERGAPPAAPRRRVRRAAPRRTAQSDRIVFAVYAMSWERTPLRFRRCLLLLMERARRPLRPVAGRVVPLSLDTFVKVRRAAPRRTAQSDRIVFAVYAMSWERTPLRFRRCLLLLMERARRPLRPVAGRVVPLSLDTFVKVRRAAPRRTAQSDRIVFAVYAMSWERTPLRFRRCLLLLMECARRPLRPVAGRVVPLSLDTFVKVRRATPCCAAPRRAERPHRVRGVRHVVGAHSAALPPLPAAADGMRAPPAAPRRRPRRAALSRHLRKGTPRHALLRRAAPRRATASCSR